MPRYHCQLEYSQLSSIELIHKLYQQYKNDFCNYIKGNFNIVISDEDQLIIVNDQLGVNRFFYTSTKELLISNKLKLITSIQNCTINKEAVMIHALMQHFIDGMTCFNEVKYSIPATIAKTFDSGVKTAVFWNAGELVTLRRNTVDFEDFSIFFREIVNSYVTYFAPKRVTTTLTGGRDTRTILAALMSLELNPRTFTFGFPEGSDVEVARKISEECGICFSNHYIKELNPNNYQDLVKQVVELGNSLIHIHRAHRLDAIIKEKNIDPNIEMVFMGAMGGDYIKGAHLDDYIVTEFVRRWWFDDISKADLIQELLTRNFIECSKAELHNLVEFFVNQDFFSHGDQKTNEFYLVHSIIGGTHDTQDMNVFSSQMKYCVSPFMDIDFLYKLFSSKFSLLSNFQTSNNPIKQLKGGELQCNIINTLYPKLSQISFNNHYKPKDILGNQYLYILKRIFTHFVKPKAKSTFSYDDWFVHYVESQINTLSIANTGDIFNLQKLKNAFNKGNHETHEGYWHKYTNVIMLKEFCIYYLNP